MKQGRFEGWYFKQQCGGHSVAFIPARHRAENGTETASLQIITEQRSWNISIPPERFYVKHRPFTVVAGNSVFGAEGCRVDCAAEGVSFGGVLRYCNLVPLAYDIMGPFALVPGMQCRHSVVSLHHRVDGSLTMGGQTMDFQDGVGYIEGDRGSSFPSRYLWTQCCWEGGSVMLSVADIPIPGGHFIGCISTVYVQGQTYRLATYLGGRVERIGGGEAVLRQGQYCLEAHLEEERSLPLQAPRQGGMERIIRESLSCRVQYRLRKGEQVLLKLTSSQASFEAEWPTEGL